ncbi:hypothetical protein N9N67_00705 [Bacteriovoracaceae bacterium]|nr:hypothetical protein [Bacteriovoracaceae bacterium]
MLKKSNLKLVIIFSILLIFWGKDKFYDQSRVNYQKVESLIIKTKKRKVSLETLIELGFFEYDKGRKILSFIKDETSFSKCDGSYNGFPAQKDEAHEVIKGKDLFPDYTTEINNSKKTLSSILPRIEKSQHTYLLSYLNIEAAELNLASHYEQGELSNRLMIKTLNSASSMYQLDNEMSSLFKRNQLHPSYLAYCRNEKDFKGHEFQFYKFPISYHLRKVKPGEKLKRKDLFKLPISDYFLDPLTLFAIIPHLPVLKKQIYIYPIMIKDKNYLGFIKFNLQEKFIRFTVSLVSISSIAEPFSLELFVENNEKRRLNTFVVDLPLGRLEANILK